MDPSLDSNMVLVIVRMILYAEKRDGMVNEGKFIFQSIHLGNPSYEGKPNKIKVEYENCESVNSAITYKF